MDDPFGLRRFLAAQDEVIDEVRAELRSGRKRSHWMWFIFPQISGLGASAMAQRYAISSLAEAEAYLRHPTLGARLIECTQLALTANARTAEEVFGAIDAMKFRSSMTLFARVALENPIFREALERYFDSQSDPATLKLL